MCLYSQGLVERMSSPHCLFGIGGGDGYDLLRNQ